jgi:hypothetical protein
MTNKGHDKELKNSPADAAISGLLDKVKIIARGPQGELFSRVLDTFLDMSEPEYFSPEDLADIQEGLDDLRQGRYLTLEEYRQGKRL